MATFDKYEWLRKHGKKQRSKFAINGINFQAAGTPKAASAPELVQLVNNQHEGVKYSVPEEGETGLKLSGELEGKDVASLIVSTYGIGQTEPTKAGKAKAKADEVTA